jgi:hypothetical protein
VLYCALEDNKRRLQARLKGLQRVEAKMDASRITFATSMPRIDQGAIGFLREWVEQADNPRLIILDCLQNVRPLEPPRGTTAYANDYNALEQFRSFANKHRVAVIVVHHDRKLEAVSAFDTVSGTLGLNGAADTLIILKKEKDGIVLHATGRDIPSVAKEMEPKSTYDEMVWHVIGDVVKVRINKQRQKLLDALTNEPQTP